MGCFKQKMRGENGCQASLHSKLFHNDFVICDVCCNMNGESALEKLQRLTRVQKHRKLQNE
jgi:hypothetical protein